MHSSKICKWLVQASKQANIHAYVRNEVMLVWSSLRLTPIIRVSYRGGGTGIPPQPQSHLPPLPRNLEIEYGYYCCAFLGGGGKACPKTPPVGTHTYTCVSVLSHATIILLPSCFTPQLKILYETLIIFNVTSSWLCDRGEITRHTPQHKRSDIWSGKVVS